MTAKERRRVLIGSPVRQKPEILDYFLTSLRRLEHDHLDVSYFFIDDNNDELSSAHLSRFMRETNHVVIHNAHSDDYDYIRNETTHYWNEPLIWKVADYKNKIIQYALDLHYDYLFLVDSDLLLAPQTLNHLVAINKEIISEIFWTRWQPDARPQPQVWLKDEYIQYEQSAGETLDEAEKEQRYQQFVSRLTEPGVYEVGGLGACTLIHRQALLRGVNYKRIYNLSFWGEDRHFCIRAAALGFTLYVDTHYPAYHIYRESDLHNAKLFLQATEEISSIPEVKLRQFEEHEGSCLRQVTAAAGTARPSLTLTIVLRNEGNRYLRQALEQHRCYIDQAVIIDDASTDNTLDVCMDILKGIPLRLIRNESSLFHNEIELRKLQWRETLNVHPEWILNLDADEWFESAFVGELPAMLEQQEFDLYCFRLYDFWNETHYRDDNYWSSHKTYRPFLLRYRPEVHYYWKETAQHCGRFPANVFELPHHLSAIRLKHYGWAKPEYRLEKYKRYRQLDPEAKFGWKEQYDSILDESPSLVEWVES
ncbi:glycosyltransferase [Paenibacillus sp. p3-SID867]|uniref:glycosyltransferase n=1 Tax=Paenibacillus sp. p3-SID867 TaxID=2916363 RepID=UPI0021A61D8E|nr:glycosyltransferase [Paenibacillus sp. p3-SID867]MCT1399283.1 glycosyltransferase [Paenibacillus sp. p3-SID867]